jgi:hypothetical protein
MLRRACYEHDNEPSDHVEGWEFLYFLPTSQEGLSFMELVNIAIPTA